DLVLSGFLRVVTHARVFTQLPRWTTRWRSPPCCGSAPTPCQWRPVPATGTSSSRCAGEPELGETWCPTPTSLPWRSSPAASGSPPTVDSPDSLACAGVTRWMNHATDDRLVWFDVQRPPHEETAPI